MEILLELITFYDFFRSLNFNQAKLLCVGCDIPNSSILQFRDEFREFLRRLNDMRLREIIELQLEIRQEIQASSTQRSPALDTLYRNLGMPSASTLEEVLDLFQIFQLFDLLMKIEFISLMKLIESIPRTTIYQQFQTIQEIRMFFLQLLPERLEQMKQDFDSIVQMQKSNFQLTAQHPHAQQHAQQHAQGQADLMVVFALNHEQFHLVQPLRLLFQLNVDVLERLQDCFSKLQLAQIRFIVQLMQIPPFDVVTLHQIPPQNRPKVEVPKFAQPQIMLQTGPRIKIVEQPPENCIYKRNVKPNPAVSIIDYEGQGSFTVTAALLRCDDMVEEPKFLTGNAPMSVSNSILIWKKLKIMVTSHQQKDSLFLLKFDLRQGTPNNLGPVVDTALSNPITVLSHSTQLRPAASTVPTIQEVIPLAGPTFGGTKVAVIGSNFNDGPSTRVRFDNVDVMPEYLGAGTLICYTPAHDPGVATVRVCNDPRRWSDTCASFTYSQQYDAYPQMKTSVSSRFHLDIAGTIQEALWRGDFDSDSKQMQSIEPSFVNGPDSLGYTLLHHAAASGNLGALQFLLARSDYASVNRADANAGNTPLHFAVMYDQLECVIALLQYGASVNCQNYNGASALHWAAFLGNERIVQVLISMRGIDLSIEDCDGATPIHYAVCSGNPTIANLLVRFGAFVDSFDDENETALVWAIRENDRDFVRALIQLGASLSNCNLDGESVFEFARLCEISGLFTSENVIPDWCKYATSNLSIQQDSQSQIHQVYSNSNANANAVSFSGFWTPFTQVLAV